MADPFGVLGAHPVARSVSAKLLLGAERLRRPSLPVRGQLPPPLAPAGSDHLVTVAIPNYNYGRYLAQAVASAVRQEGVRVEVVIVDDCSTDDSYEIAQKLQADHAEVTALRNDTNSGPGITFNRAWQAGAGQFVVRLDADDILTPGCLARAVAVMEAFPEVGLVYGRVQHFEGDTPPAPVEAPAHAVVWSGHDWAYRAIQDDRNLISTPEAMLRRSVMERHGAWKPELVHSQDFEMWLRAATFSDVGYVAGPAQALKRYHVTSLGQSEGSVGTRPFVEHLAAYDSWYRDVADQFPAADRYYSLGRRGLAQRAVRHALHSYRRGVADHEAVTTLGTMASELAPDLPRLATLSRYARATQRFGPRAVRMSPPALWGSACERLRLAGVQAGLERDGY